LGHAGYFATYLLYVVFAGCGLRMTEASRKWRALGMIAAALGSAAIVLSGARAAILGLVVGFVFLLMWLRPRIRTRAVAGAIALLVGGAVFYFSPAGQKLRSRTHWYIEDPRGGMRLWIWRDALRMGGRHWLAGTGLETFSSEFPRFESDSLARAYPDFYHESPHNIFLDALTAQGAPGLIVLLGLSGLGFYAAWRARHAERVVSGALGAALAAGLFSQQFSSFTLPTAMYFYVTIALLVAVMVRRQTVGQALPPAFKLVLLVIVAVFAMRLVVADVLLARVQRHLETGQVKQAIETYQGFERWQPPGASSDLWYSRSLAAAAQKAPTPLAAVQGWQQAMEAAIRAAQRSEDRHNAYYNLAAFYAHVNDFPHTEQSLRAAIAWAPNWFKPHWMLAQVLRAAGRLPEARAEAALAADLNGGKNPEVARTWEEIRASSKVD
jgi:tetratricopeptide (TPR) repeat protein